MARLGTPAGLIATTAFQKLALHLLEARRVTGLPLVVVDHPLGGERPDGIARRAEQAVEQMTSLLGRP